MGVHLWSNCRRPFRESSLWVSLRFWCSEDDERVGTPPSTSRAAFACGGIGGCTIHGGWGPQFFFERISRLETTMRAVGVAKSNSESIQIILRQLPERYDVVKTMSLADPQITRPRLENTIRSAYSQRKAHEIAKLGPAAGTPAGPPNYAWGGHSSHVFILSGAYFGDCGDIFPRLGYSRRGSSDVYFVGSGDIFPRRGFSRRDTGGVSSSAWGGAFLPCLHLERRRLRRLWWHLHAAGVFPSRFLRQHLPAAGVFPPRFLRQLPRFLR